MFGPIFTCSCCHVNHFESNNVTVIDEDLRTKILTKYPECLEDCVQEFVKVMINENTNYYLCIRYMKSKKMPPMSVCNGLDVVAIDDPDFQLSELANNLFALRIMFQKIYYLPKSRWTALKDRVINIPIEKENIINTITQLPRLPTESGLVEIKLKRKMAYKNNHKREFVDPNKIFKALEFLKACGHPGYKDFNSREEYLARCKNSDEEGYESVFGQEFEADDLFEELNAENIDFGDNNVNDELLGTDTDDGDDEAYYKTNDPGAISPVLYYA